MFETIKAERADNTAEEFGALDRVDVDRIGQKDGILSLVEKTAHSARFLYIGQAKSITEAVRPFTKQATFDALANSFWSPSLSQIYLLVYDIHEKYRDASQTLWTKKLIHEKSPVFNWPIRLTAA